ncbi:MAG: CHASE3 domain-containing protein [Cyanobacteriota bacterium]|nr:CHASE3 domain-containing protein [Cyanobacteriota bacterium]
MKKILYLNLQSFWAKMPVQSRGRFIIAIPVTYFIITLVALYWLKLDWVEDENLVQHTQTVRLETQHLLAALIDAETGVRGYAMTGRQDFLVPYREAIAEIPQSLDILRRLVSDNPEQISRLKEVRKSTEETLAILEQKLAKMNARVLPGGWKKRERTKAEIEGDFSYYQSPLQEQFSPPKIYDWLEEAKALMDTTREKIDAFAAEEERLLEERQEHLEFEQILSLSVLSLSGVLGIASGIFSLHLFGNLERELSRERASLRETNERLEEARMAAELANQKLQSAYEELQRFTANASHELRSPLAAILSNAQVGLLGPDDDATQPRKRLEKIVEVAKYMKNLVGNLLFLARCERLPETVVEIDLKELLKKWIYDCQLQAKAKNFDWIINLPPAPVMAEVEPELLGQAVVNLIQNACKYTPAGGSIEVELKTDLVSQKPGFFKKPGFLTDSLVSGEFLIVVKDTGIGIPEADLARIFERFYRVEGGRSRQGGFGLGLAIAEQIVRLHDGLLAAESVVGQGSTFTVSLPQTAKVKVTVNC